MKITPRTGGVFEMLKAEVDLAEVVGRFTELEDHGVLKSCLCPLKEQSSGNPAFKIYGDSFYCFSCEAWGDVVSFWRLMHDFPSNWAAAQDLASEYGIELPQSDPEALRRYEERRQKVDMWACTANRNRETLLKQGSPISQQAREYLSGRGFTEEHWERFMLGVDGKRVTIPYFFGGQIHGQAARAITGDLEPKYLYPKAEEFPLGRRPLFMQESPRAQEYLLVEGFFDQLAAAVLDIPAIAAGSAGFSKEQMADLLDMAAKGATFVINADKDERGRERARKMLEKLYPYARIMPELPGEDIKDVADFYRAHGREAADEIRELMGEAQDAIELALVEMGELGRPADKVKLLKRSVVPSSSRSPSAPRGVP